MDGTVFHNSILNNGKDWQVDLWQSSFPEVVDKFLLSEQQIMQDSVDFLMFMNIEIGEQMFWTSCEKWNILVHSITRLGQSITRQDNLKL